LPDSFARKVSEAGGPYPDIRAKAFNPYTKSPTASSGALKPPSTIPPRLLSDQYINIFFQEWAPLLPILHRPTFLRVYEQYLADPDAGKWHGDKQAVAQLFLIFDIAALSSISRTKQSTTMYERQWRKAIHSSSSRPSISAIQCHVLAQLYYLLRADYTHAARHRAIAVSMCHQMGLHHSQKYHLLNYLELETRKKAFWCQYALDKYAISSSWLPELTVSQVYFGLFGLSYLTSRIRHQRRISSRC
jgi:Fungal specific transcription factor domain